MQKVPLTISVATVSILSLFPTIAQAEASVRPNVIIILADDLGWADLGCYGSKYHKTPNLDRLAAQGMRFTDAYAACPVCSPTRASIMTGKYPARLNLTDWLPGRPDRPDQKLLRPIINQQLPASETTIAAELRKAGYATGHVGKWHLGGKGSLPQDRGFDVNIGGDAAGSPRSYFAPYKNKQGVFIPKLENAPDGEYLTDRLTTESIQLIESKRDKPFFLYLAHYTVHIPLKAKAELVKKYKRGRPGEQGNPIYAAMIESLDEGVGRILKKLDELKLTERTLIVFTSDNGGLCVMEGPNTPATINAPLREGKGYLYEGGIREPLIVKWPNVIRPGSTSDVPVCSIDLFPTILDACGVKGASGTGETPVKTLDRRDAGPTKGASGTGETPVKTLDRRDAGLTSVVDGVSLVPLLKGGELKRDALYWHYPHYSNQGGKPGAAVRAGDYKLIEFYENGRQELYDVRKDRGELRNLIADKPMTAKKLSAKLTAWRKEVGAKMMKPNPDFVPNPQKKDGTVTLPARTAEVHGIQLRYEPLPHKNTLGFWTRADDWVSWNFTLTKPGLFDVSVLQGCGKGQGGSEVAVSLDGHELTFTVEDTGHFQNFKARTIGRIELSKPGRHALTVKAKKKAAGAVMDLRTVTLKPVNGRN
ncbi:MAG TPA: sulfatase-like hydrolase/transferase [Gemmataceae bacterium]|nr:sulfatase-like hydrolase/transferase [Gemmataceae bacterium]